MNPLLRTEYKVYPRVCGGTTLVWPAAQPAIGLSPRVRGNLSTPAAAGQDPGSIPACAGEPHCASFPCSAMRVYPRVCGGTHGGG